MKDCSKKAYLDVVTENIILDIKGKQHIPSRYEINKSSTFGKPSIDHLFTSEACFEHVLIFILKSGYVQKPDKDILLDSHLLFKYLNKMLNWSNKIKFISKETNNKLRRPKNYRHIKSK